MLCNKSNLVFKQIILHNRRFVSSKSRAFEEIKIPVPWGHVAGKWWQPSNTRPILAIHGIQDNCGTFDRLIPLLNNNVGFLTIDLPGHGYSSRLQPGMYYHFMHNVILIKHIANYFQWPKVSLMGHSMGGITAYTYTMLFPDEVDYVICIDGVKPLIKKNNAPRMAEGIKELVKYDELSRSNEEPPSYPMQELTEKLAINSQLMNNQQSIDFDHCHHILKRNTAPSRLDPNKYYFTRDPRLKSRLVLNWPQKELVENAVRVTSPIFMCKFTESGYFEDKENFYEVFEVLKKSSRDCEYHYVPGRHHTHLNNPELLSPLINNFLDKHCHVRSSLDKSVNKVKS